MAENKVKEGLKEKIDRLKRKIRQKKTEGKVKIEGVDNPKKKPSKAKEKPPEFKAPKKDKNVIVGPKGGKAVISTSGKKYYEGKVSKAQVEDVASALSFESFIEAYRKARGK